jgi:hypothetical protein
LLLRFDLFSTLLCVTLDAYSVGLAAADSAASNIRTVRSSAPISSTIYCVTPDPDSLDLVAAASADFSPPDAC